MLIAPKSKALNLLGLRPTGDLGPLTGYTSKRGKPVWFLKAPPKKPPTGWQIHQRNLFRQIARHWNELPALDRLDWQRAAERAHLNITGYNLFVYFHTTRDRHAIATVEQQSGITLVKYT